MLLGEEGCLQTEISGMTQDIGVTFLKGTDLQFEITRELLEAPGGHREGHTLALNKFYFGKLDMVIDHWSMIQGSPWEWFY